MNHEHTGADQVHSRRRVQSGIQPFVLCGDIRLCDLAELYEHPLHGSRTLHPHSRGRVWESHKREETNNSDTHAGRELPARLVEECLTDLLNGNAVREAFLGIADGVLNVAHVVDHGIDRGVGVSADVNR